MEKIDIKLKGTKRPRDSKFTQQRLSAWRPTLSLDAVLPLMAAISGVFVPTGIFLYTTASRVKEMKILYSEGSCIPINRSISNCNDFIRSHPGQRCNCEVKFTISESLPKQVYMYYALTNFYQSHRTYVKSCDYNQLRGGELDYSSLSSSCGNFRGDKDTGAGYAPCGAIANSLFNDTIDLVYNDSVFGSQSVPLIKTGIAWKSDKEQVFRNPASWDRDHPETWRNNKTRRPPNWHVDLMDLDPVNSDNNGYKNEDLIVWMRIAAFPSFKKLYRIIDHSAKPFKDGLPDGEYKFIIGYAYPVVEFDGTKSVIFSTTSWLGGKNSFLGIAYMVVGGLFILTAFILVFISRNWGDRHLKSVIQELRKETVHTSPDEEETEANHPEVTSV